MDLYSIRDALRREPFVPFAMCLADGRRVALKHPEFLAMNKRRLVVIAEVASWSVVEPHLIVSLDYEAFVRPWLFVSMPETATGSSHVAGLFLGLTLSRDDPCSLRPSPSGHAFA